MSVGISQAGTGEETMIGCYSHCLSPVKPIRFLLPVKTDYRLGREGEFNKWSWERAIFYMQGALWGNKTFWQFGCVYPKMFAGNTECICIL